MRIHYTEFDREEAMRRLSRKQIMQLWNHLLLQTAGDVDHALELMEYLWERHNFFNGEYTFEEFKADLEGKRMIARGQGEDGQGRGEGEYNLTALGERTIRKDSLDAIFGSLKSSTSGDHRTPREGSGGDKLAETRPSNPGDLSGDIDYRQSLTNSLKRGVDSFDLREDDLEVHEREHFTSCATVLMIDISHSMILYGEDRITPAKRVAIALAELIQTKYPKDSLEVVTFGNEARQISVKDLPYLQVGPYYTNTQAGLQLAQRLLRKKRQGNKQIFMVTDGKPSVITENGEMYRNSFGLDPKVVNKTLEEAAQCRRKKIEISTFMIAQDPILVEFVERLTQTNKGRAYYSSLDKLGGFILVDYIKNRRRRMH